MSQTLSTEETTEKSEAEADCSARSCSAIPAFFAGVFCIEENVRGGTGETPDDAVADYFANYADDEIDYYTPLDEESGTITVEVFKTYEPEPDDEENVGDWKWMCGERVEKREYSWKIEEDHAAMPKIIYLPNDQGHRPATEAE